MLLIGGLIGYQQYRHAQEERWEYAANDELLDEMIEAHDAKPDRSDFVALGASLSDPAALSAEAQQRLGRSVPLQAKSEDY